MSDNQIIEVQPIIIEEVKKSEKASNSSLKSLLLGGVAGLLTGLAGTFAFNLLMPKDDVLGKMQVFQKEAASLAESEFNKKLNSLQSKFDEQNKAHALKINALEVALKNLPEIKEVTKFENSDALKAQIEELKLEITKISPKMTLFEKEQGANKSSQTLALGYIALSNLERGEASPQEVKRLALSHASFNGLNSLSEKAIVTPALLIKTLKSATLKAVKQEEAGGWLDKIKQSASALVKVTHKDTVMTPQFGELEAALTNKDYNKATQLWNALKTAVENDKGFEAQLQLAKKQSEDIAHIRTILAKMSAEQ